MVCPAGQTRSKQNGVTEVTPFILFLKKKTKFIFSFTPAAGFLVMKLIERIKKICYNSVL